jgi:hypothetical protein
MMMEWDTMCPLNKRGDHLRCIGITIARIGHLLICVTEGLRDRCIQHNVIGIEVVVDLILEIVCLLLRGLHKKINLEDNGDLDREEDLVVGRPVDLDEEVLLFRDSIAGTT